MLLGLDVSPSKVGIGAVLDEDGSPALPATFELVDGPESIRELVGALYFRLGSERLEPMVAYLERPGHAARGGAGQLDAGIAIGMWWFALRHAWPHLVIDTITATAWRSKVGLPRPESWPVKLEAHERRRWWKNCAIAEAGRLGFELPEVGKRLRRYSDDAAEGALIARACWLDAEDGRIEGLRGAA